MPRALAVLEQLSSGAVDVAIASALPDMNDPGRTQAFELLMRRAHAPALAQLVGSFHAAPSSIQSLVIHARRGLERGFRLAIGSASFARRSSAVEAIVAADAVELAYLLPDALKGDCPRTRAIAAHALIALAESVLDSNDSVAAHAAPAHASMRRACMVDALGAAIHSWELHRQVDVLKAALCFGRHIVPAVQRKLARRPVRIDRPIGELLCRARDVRTVEFLWCALAEPALRRSAVRTMESMRDPLMIRAVIDNAWLLKDPAIAAGLRAVRSCPWLFGPAGAAVALEGADAVRAVRMVTACGARHDAKLDRFATWLRDGSDAVQRAVVWSLVEDPSRGATTLLRDFAAPSPGCLAEVVREELDRRERRDRPSLSARRVSAVGHAFVTDAPRDAMDSLFDAFDRISSADRRSRALTYQTRTGLLAVGLRKRLRSSDARRRRQALALIRALGWIEQFDEYVCHLAHDRDARTRSLAVAMLANLPGGTSSRILRSVLDDPDERVQANAIEALDRLELPARLDLSLRKLDAPDNRVRANAVRSLLRMGVGEARDALRTMLSEASARHRRSALWVVERLCVREMRTRVVDMAVSDPDERVRARAARTRKCLDGDARDAGETNRRTTPQLVGKGVT